MKTIREISPAVGISADDWVRQLPSELKAAVEDIRRQKREGRRSRPSATLMDRSALMTKAIRGKLLDLVADLVDENYAGRAEMCIQFAALLDRALSHLKFPSRPVVGTAIYYGDKGEELFRWTHAWVRIGDEVVDGNVDSLAENPRVPKNISVAPYWGPISEVPANRRLREDRDMTLPADGDVEDVWWPELRQWINQEMLK
jgi:hypothetical protein